MMPLDNPLQIVASAVTPVVLVSATAILIGTVNTRHIAIADRVRALMHEFRDSGASPARRACILQQLPLFRRRTHLVSWAIRGLYLATACFIAMALLISATLWRQMLAIATLPLFILGILLLMASIVCQLLELSEANRTIDLEIADIGA